MTEEINRRMFVKGSVLASAGAALGLAAGAPAVSGEPASSPANLPAPQTGLPKGKIGKLEISRMLLGGNLLTHFTHSRELRYVYNLAAHYNTQKKILETLALAEQNGINTLVIHTAAGIVDLLKKHREKYGGKIQWIICPTNPIEPGLAKYEEQVQKLVDDGVDAIYIWGVQSDAMLGDGKFDLVAKAVDLVKTHGVPCGVGAHMLHVVQECEKNKVNNDFYIKTFHHHNYSSAATVKALANRGPDLKEKSLGVKTVEAINCDAMWCFTPQETIDFMRGVEKPWIAFKVMAAGAIPPQDAFRYAFVNGADFALVGMFDFEIAEDVRIAREVLAGLPQRARPWRG